MQKRFRGGTREWLWIVAGALLLAAALFLPLGYALAEGLSSEEQTLLEAYEKGEIIRIHIVANSDSAQDQEIKLKVRDALIERFGHMLVQAEEADADAVYELLVRMRGEMLHTAKCCAAQYGFTGRISAEAGMLELPEKAYGNVVLPSGKYRGLRITLGDGNGQNWWCVLYPQLCLALSEQESEENALVWKTQHILQHWLLLK